MEVSPKSLSIRLLVHPCAVIYLFVFSAVLLTSYLRKKKPISGKLSVERVQRCFVKQSSLKPLL